MAARQQTTLGVVHVTVTPPGWDRGAAGIRAIHKAQGWSDIGYSEIINPDGRPEMGRGKMAIGAMSPDSTRSPTACRRTRRATASSNPSST